MIHVTLLLISQNEAPPVKLAEYDTEELSLDRLITFEGKQYSVMSDTRTSPVEGGDTFVTQYLVEAGINV